MGFISSLGSKVSSGINYLGQKAGNVAKIGRKFVHDHAAQIERGAKITADVAGFVGNVATAALPFTAAIPGVGEIVAGAAAGGKALEYGARMVQKGAGAAKYAESAYTHGESAVSHGHHAIDDLRRGHLIDTYKEGKDAYEEVKKARKDIERIRK